MTGLLAFGIWFAGTILSFPFFLVSALRTDPAQRRHDWMGNVALSSCLWFILVPATFIDWLGRVLKNVKL